MKSKIDLEKEISSTVAKYLKGLTGRGPTYIETIIYNGVMFVKVLGTMLPYEKEMAKTDQGNFDVKINRLKWVAYNENQLSQILSESLGKEISDFFYDVRPNRDIALLVAYF